MSEPETVYGLNLTRDQARLLLHLVEVYHDEDMPLSIDETGETDEMRLVQGLLNRLNSLLGT